MQRRDTGDSVVFAPRRRRSDPEVTHLIDQIRDLVAQQRRLEGGAESKRRHAGGTKTENCFADTSVAVSLFTCVLLTRTSSGSGSRQIHGSAGRSRP